VDTFEDRTPFILVWVQKREHLVMHTLLSHEIEGLVMLLEKAESGITAGQHE
jgi:hypothetical protein